MQLLASRFRFKKNIEPEPKIPGSATSNRPEGRIQAAYVIILMNGSKPLSILKFCTDFGISGEAEQIYLESFYHYNDPTTES